MEEIRTFINTFSELYNQAGYAKEEEQILPPLEIMNEVCSTILNASCIREEGLFSSFRVCFLKEKSDILDAYLYSHRLKLEKPIPFTVPSLKKLVPATNPSMSYLTIDLSSQPYMITDIIASFSSWEKVRTGELSSGSAMPLIPNFLCKGPGEIDACIGERVIVSYTFGRTQISRSDVFVDSLVADVLRAGSDVSDKERLQFLSRVLWKVSHYRHGGALLILPVGFDETKYLDIKYRISSRFIFNEEKSLVDMSKTAREKELVSYSDFVAKLTTVDGAVIMDKNLDLYGFGAEILTDRMERRTPKMRFLKQDNTDDPTKRFDDNGTRHRSGYRLCNCMEDSVAIICSQDGMIRACTKQDGAVVVYSNIVV